MPQNSRFKNALASNNEIRREIKLEVVVRDTGNTGGKISSNSNANIVVKESRAKKKKKKKIIKILKNSESKF